MYNKSLVIPGIIIFLLIVLSPIIYNSTSASAPELPSTTIKTHAYPHSIPIDTWKSEHMKYVNATSIADCKTCHANTAVSCDKCHGFVGVKPSVLD